MDELRMVRTMLDRPAPDDAVVAKGRERLRTETRGRRRTMPARRTLWATGGLGLTAATAAAAVAISTTGTAGTAENRSAGPRAGRSTTTTTLDARSILLAAASSAEGQADRVGGYWHTVSVGRYYYRAGTAGSAYTIVDQQRDDMWTPSAPRQAQVSVSQHLGVQPATAADRAAWTRAGSPADISVQAADGKGGRVTLSTRPGRVMTSRSPLVDGDKVFWLGRNVTMKDLRALPADPRRLKASLKRWYQGHGTESSSETMSSDLWLYTVARGLIMDMPVTPKVRGAAFRMLADLPSVTAAGRVQDAQGRTGTAIAITERTKVGGTYQHRLIIDTTAGRALGEELVVVKPGGSTAGFAPGAVWNSTTVVRQGWTDSAPPGGSAAPRGGTSGGPRPGASVNH
ncbi:CU044_5270 family protein [Actinoallomurus soli]|uniref:CU044_5270 family protein n=1 Tax=Actinoallomurus soli TaxID=2952535 RepID=UPI002092F3BC|nr:CU044_5270 family protein [Actinoallomurus soli]MCO5968839.1 CU044_5270 family protein [Actinoallomurus soli]